MGLNKKKFVVILSYFFWLSIGYANNISATQHLDLKEYQSLVTNSRNQIQILLTQFKSYKNYPLNTRIALITQEFLNLPYLNSNAMGEGDWQAQSSVYLSGALHIQQNPVYRLDGFNCQTFVQMVMALTLSNSLQQFDNNYLKIAYGAAGNPNHEIIRYYNRNNFIEADFNPINQKNGYLIDATNDYPLLPYTKLLKLNITRQQWFLQQQKNINANVNTLSHSQFNAMRLRFINVYSHLNFPNFKLQTVSLRYIPKEFLVLKRSKGEFIPNQALINAIPTPAIVEIVRDAKLWYEHGVNIKTILGSEIAVSHLGFLYRQTFKKGELIYYKTHCHDTSNHQALCQVKPIFCEKNSCPELMFIHASNGYPKNFYWYQTNKGNYTCSGKKPTQAIPYTFCNRVITLPFYDYLTDYQFGHYSNMEMVAVLGIHIEKLVL